MFRASCGTFAIVVSFINSSCEPCDVTIGIFKVHNIVGVTMANQVKLLLNSFGILDKVITYVKDKGSNLNILIFELAYVISYYAF
jgi:hypothetical protein